MMSEDKGQAEIVDSEAEKPVLVQENEEEKSLPYPPPEWKPFWYAPKNIQTRYKKQLEVCHTSPTTAIKMCCIECMGYQPHEPKMCDAHACPLYAYNRKFFLGAGKKKVEGTEEQKERMAKARKAKK